jgi:hypothetical protein
MLSIELLIYEPKIVLVAPNGFFTNGSETPNNVKHKEATTIKPSEPSK